MTRTTLCSLAAAAFAAAAAATAGAAGPGGGMTVAASSRAAGAHDVRLTVTLHYEMQCGYPGATPVSLRVPGSLPQTVHASAVLVNGKPAARVAAQGRRLTIAMQPRPQILCDSITTGRLTLVLTEAAGLANPAKPGSYAVAATKGPLAFAARLAVTGG